MSSSQKPSEKGTSDDLPYTRENEVSKRRETVHCKWRNLNPKLTPETKFLVNDLPGSPVVPAPHIIHPGMTSFVEADSVEF